MSLSGSTENISASSTSLLSSLLEFYKQQQAYTLLVQLPMFSGNPSVRFDRWIRQFENIVSSLSPSEKVHMLAQKVTGPAYEFLHNILDSDSDFSFDYDYVKTILHQNYHGFETEDYYQMKFDTCKREHEENVIDFAYRLKTILCKAYPSVKKPDSNQKIHFKLFRRKFLDELQPDLRYKIQFKDVETIDDLIFLAQKYSIRIANLKEDQTKQHSQNLKQTSSNFNTIEASTLSINADIRQTQEEYSDNQFRLKQEIVPLHHSFEICGYCGIRGHVPENCEILKQRNLLAAKSTVVCYVCQKPGHHALNCSLHNEKFETVNTVKAHRQKPEDKFSDIKPKTKISQKVEKIESHRASAAPRVSITVQNIYIEALFDTGSARSLLHENLFHTLPQGTQRNCVKSLDDSLLDAQMKKLDIVGKISLPVCFDGVTLLQEFLITNGISETCILGADAFFLHEFVFDGKNKKIFLARNLERSISDYLRFDESVEILDTCQDVKLESVENSSSMDNIVQERPQILVVSETSIEKGVPAVVHSAVDIVDSAKDTFFEGIQDVHEKVLPRQISAQVKVNPLTYLVDVKKSNLCYSSAYCVHGETKPTDLLAAEMDEQDYFSKQTWRLQHRTTLPKPRREWKRRRKKKKKN